MTRGHPGGSPLAEQLQGVPVTVMGLGLFGGGFFVGGKRRGDGCSQGAVPFGAL